MVWKLFFAKTICEKPPVQTPLFQFILGLQILKLCNKYLKPAKPLCQTK